jgi:DNA modification methylase
MATATLDAFGLNQASSSKSEGNVQVRLEPLHRFHSYCARFPSEVAEAAIRDYSKPGDGVLDPFCGSGTSLTAGLLQHRRVIGADVDILAGMLSRVKCFPQARTRYAAWRNQFAEKLRAVFSEIEAGWPAVAASTRPGAQLSIGDVSISLPNFPELSYWFPPQLSAALAGIAQAAHECRNEHYEQVALVSLSASIISKWPNTLSYAMDIDHTRPHRQIQKFHLGRVLETYLTRFDRTIGCLGSLHEAYGNAGITANLPDLARVICPHDARLELPDVTAESQSLVITSPPYFNAVDYPRAHRMSVCWMNGHAPEDLASRRSYIGLHRAKGFDCSSWLQDRPNIRRQIPSRVAEDTLLLRHLAGFFADLERVLMQVHYVLRPGSHAVFVIGDNFVRGQRIASHSVLIELARALGFEKRSSSHRKIVSLRRRYPVGQFGFDGPMTHEFVVVLKRPPARSKRKAGDA